MQYGSGMENTAYSIAFFRRNTRGNGGISRCKMKEKTTKKGVLDFTRTIISILRAVRQTHCKLSREVKVLEPYEDAR